jgi:hypothetical protein
MVQFIQRNPGFGERLGAGIGQGVGKVSDFLMKMKLQEAKQKQDKAIEKEQAFHSMQGTIDQLKSMAEEDVAGIGLFGQWDPRPEAQQNRGKFQTLGSDLLSFYKSLFPRGITQQEFIRLERDYIPKPGEATSKMIGKLEGFQNLIKRKLQELGEESPSGKVKFDVSNPQHKAKRDQLLKRFKGDREKVSKILEREFSE